MDLPAVQLLYLEQMDRSLEDHTRDFLDLACLTHFPDCSLCGFYITSLSERCKVRLLANGPKEEDFATFVEWVLENNGSSLTVFPSEEDISSPTSKPETSRHPAARSYCLSPLQTEPEPAATELIIATELLSSSDQVCEPATPGVLVVIKGLEGSPAHTPVTEGELQLVSGSYKEEIVDIFKMDLIDWFGEVLTCDPESPASLLVLPSSCLPVFPPGLPLLPPLKPASSSASSPLVHVSPSVHPQSAPAVCSDPPPRDFQPPAPPWLLASSSPPWPVIPLAPPGSLVPPAPPWSVVDHPPSRDSAPLASPRHSIPPALSRLLLPFGSTFILSRTGSTVVFRTPTSASVA